VLKLSDTDTRIVPLSLKFERSQTSKLNIARAMTDAGAYET
jgi:hypothetical protein